MTGKGKTRLTIKAQAMRELMSASGGRCAILTADHRSRRAPGTGSVLVAHIVGEEDGPRGQSPMTPPGSGGRRQPDFTCAQPTGVKSMPSGTDELNFPVERLRAMKDKDEAKVNDAVTAAIEQDQSVCRRLPDPSTSPFVEQRLP
jgi:hypothetical protein